MIYINEKTIRTDGRLNNQLRSIQITHGRSNNSGWVSLKQGTTNILGLITIPSDRENFNIELSYCGIAREEPINDRKLYCYKYKLMDIFSNLIPENKAFDLNLIVKQDGGSTFASLVNCATLALCFNGIPIKEMCTAITLNECVDLSEADKKNNFEMTIVYLNNSDKILNFELSGKCQKKLFKETLINGIQACKSINKYISGYLRDLGSRD